ncbi:MAG TPA: hypothetical protein VJ521_07495, partial [Acidobacteriota bacterium]|nr:hypothetical protein [Acidobacteriota bacterium]
YKLTLRDGKSVQGKLIRVDSTSVTIEDSSKTKRIVKRSEIVEAFRATRTYDLEDLNKLPKLSYESKEPSDPVEKKVSRTYGGKSEEYWAAETLRLGLKSKQSEQSYEQLIRDCRLPKPSDPLSCNKAKESVREIQKLSEEYNQLLTEARKASVPIDWLETQYKWIRWGQEWKN